MARWITEQVAVSGTAISPDDWPKLLKELGIMAIVNLRMEYQDVFTAPWPMAYLWLPVKDHTSPSPEQLRMGAQFIDEAVKAGHKVLVHCKMGIGRSPTLAAAYLIWTGLTVDEAIGQIEGRPRLLYGPVVSRFALNEFAKSLK